MEPARLDVESMRALLLRVDALPDDVRSELIRVYADEPHPDRAETLRPRDHAWSRAQRAIDAHGLGDELDRLWPDVIARLRRSGRLTSLAVLDAVLATLLSPWVEAGPFRVSDRDLLMAPWRCVVEGCARSRLALALAQERTTAVDEAWWAAVGAVHADAPTAGSPT